MLSEYQFSLLPLSGNRTENQISSICVVKDVRRTLRIQITESLTGGLLLFLSDIDPEEMLAQAFPCNPPGFCYLDALFQKIWCRISRQLIKQD